MRTASATYLPPRNFPGAQAYWDNLKRLPAKGELILFSEADWPGVVKIGADPAAMRRTGHDTFIEGAHAGKVNAHAINNLLFLIACKIAIQRGITHLLYLESDCRVGKEGWDEIIFDEYFSIGHPAIVAGTLSIYNPSNTSLDAAQRAAAVINHPRAHGVPVGVYGWLTANQPGPFCVFPNGALAVYDLDWITRLFDPNNADPSTLEVQARQNTAYDLAIGQHLAKMFGPDAYSVVGYLESVFSGFGDLLTTEEQRRELLASGKIAAAHQFKSDWNP